MKRTVLATLLAVTALCFLAVPAAWALTKNLESMNEIKNMAVKDDQNLTSVDMETDIRAKIEDIAVKILPGERLVRVTLPGCYTDPPKRYYYKVESDTIRRANIFQINSKTAVVNLWVKPEYETALDRVRVEQKSDRIVIQLWKTQPPVPAAALGVKDKETPVPPDDEAKSAEAANQEAAPVMDAPIDLSKLFADGAKKEEAPGAAEPAAPAPAEEKAASPIGGHAPSLGESMVKMTVALFLCLGLIALIFAAYKKFGKGGAVFGAAFQRPMRLVSSIAVGPKKQVSVLDVGGEYFLVGSSENQISLLAKIENPETVDRLRGVKPEAVQVPTIETPKETVAKISEDAIEAAAGSESPFLSELAREMGRYREAANGAANGNGKTHAPDAGEMTLKAIRERLATMKRI